VAWPPPARWARSPASPAPRAGALTYLAALDIGRRGGRQPRVFGRSERRARIAAFDRLVSQVMRREPYASIFFSILQRKVLPPNDYEDLAVLAS
jgi:hypothetical protein